MSTPEKPLHVRVDEALYGPWSPYWSKHGYWIVSRPCRHPEGHSRLDHTQQNGFFPERVTEDYFTGGARGWTPYDPMTGKKTEPEPWWSASGDWIPNYDTDWSATGPLIERLGITVVLNRDRDRHGPDYSWVASAGTLPFSEPGACGATPLLAVCHLILALHEAGKLPKGKAE